MTATARYDIRPVRVRKNGRTFNHFALFADDGTRVSGFYRTVEQARESRTALIRTRVAKARPVERPCLCCGHRFMSQGIHNRLCEVCATGTPRSHW